MFIRMCVGACACMYVCSYHACMHACMHVCLDVYAHMCMIVCDKTVSEQVRLSVCMSVKPYPCAPLFLLVNELCVDDICVSVRMCLWYMPAFCVLCLCQSIRACVCTSICLPVSVIFGTCVRECRFACLFVYVHE